MGSLLPPKATTAGPICLSFRSLRCSVFLRPILSCAPADLLGDCRWAFRPLPPFFSFLRSLPHRTAAVFLAVSEPRHPRNLQRLPMDRRCLTALTYLITAPGVWFGHLARHLVPLPSCKTVSSSPGFSPHSSAGFFHPSPRL